MAVLPAACRRPPFPASTPTPTRIRCEHRSLRRYERLVERGRSPGPMAVFTRSTQLLGEPVLPTWRTRRARLVHGLDRYGTTGSQSGAYRRATRAAPTACCCKRTCLLRSTRPRPVPAADRLHAPPRTSRRAWSTTTRTTTIPATRPAISIRRWCKTA